MPLIIPPGFAQAVLRWNLTGDAEAMVITMGYDVSGEGGDFNGFADSLASQYFISWGAGGRLNSYGFAGVSLYVGQDGAPPLVYESIASGAPGTSTSNPPPSNCSMLLRKRTDLGGRRGRGRCYPPPFALAEGDVDANGNISGAVRTALESNFISWLFTGREPVLLHTSGGVTSPPAPTPITSLILDTKIATQRQRLRR